MSNVHPQAVGMCILVFTWLYNTQLCKSGYTLSSYQTQLKAIAVIINGEVVPDEDPRAVRYRSRGSVHRNNNPAPAPPMNRTASLGSEVQGDVSFYFNLQLLS